MPMFKWSKTAATNATADPAINWAEGQAPSSINDSARSMMARLAEWRDDITGAIVTSGTSTAYTVSSNQGFDTLAHLDGQMIAFTPHTTNGATVTLNVDSLGAKPLRSSPGVELGGGILVQGTPYVAVYNTTDSSFYLQGFYGNPYSVPLGGMMDYIWSTAPNSSFVLPYGQAISRTTYSSLYSLIGVQYGAGDGSTTFNVPDLRGRVVAVLDNLGGSAANRLTGAAVTGSGTTLGGSGGAQAPSIAQNQLPNIAPAFSGTPAVITVTATRSDILVGGFPTTAGSAGGIWAGTGIVAVQSQGNYTPSGSVASINGNVTQQGMVVVQPTIVLSKILRVI